MTIDILVVERRRHLPNEQFWLRSDGTYRLVAILQEESRESRIIPIDSPPASPRPPRQWRGLSRGYWEGDTLVVATTHFDTRASFQGSSPDLNLTEHFVRRADDTLQYEFTIDDPASFTRRWSAMVWMRFTDQQLWEYACHEGNYSMPLILGTARAVDR